MYYNTYYLAKVSTSWFWQRERHRSTGQMRETKIDLLAKICPLLFDKGTTAIQWKDNLQNMVL